MSKSVFLEVRDNKSNPYQILDTQSKRKNEDFKSDFKTFRVQSSSVLNHAKAFLPLMKSANKKLSDQVTNAKDPSTLDIENTDGYQGDLIEFNLAVVENNKLDDDDVDNSLFFHAFKDIQPMTETGGMVTEKMTTNNKQAGIEILKEDDLFDDESDNTYSSSSSEESSDSETEYSDENTILFDE